MMTMLTIMLMMLLMTMITMIMMIMVNLTYVVAGVRNNDSAYLIELPTWSTTVVAAGTKITLVHEANQYKDELYIVGPITEPVKVVVSFQFVFSYRLDYREWKALPEDFPLCWFNYYQKRCR